MFSKCRHLFIVFPSLAGEKLDGLVGGGAAEEGGHRVQLGPAVPTNLVDVVVLKHILEFNLFI